MEDEGYKLDPNLEKHNRNTLIYNHKTLDNKTVKALQEKIYNNFYECSEYAKRVKKTCKIDARFTKAFNDYFESLGKGQIIDTKRKNDI